MVRVPIQGLDFAGLVTQAEAITSTVSAVLEADIIENEGGDLGDIISSLITTTTIIT